VEMPRYYYGTNRGVLVCHSIAMKFALHETRRNATGLQGLPDAGQQLRSGTARFLIQTSYSRHA
jgi:hypothetical protein